MLCNLSEEDVLNSGEVHEVLIGRELRRTLSNLLVHISLLGLEETMGQRIGGAQIIIVILSIPNCQDSLKGRRNQLTVAIIRRALLSQETGHRECMLQCKVSGPHHRVVQQSPRSSSMQMRGQK